MSVTNHASLVLVPLLVLTLTIGCAKEASMPPASAAVVRVSAGGPELTFALVPGRCVAGKCPAAIELVSGQKLLDSAALEFAASDAKLVKEQGDTGLGASAGLEAWTAGTEEGAVTTAVQGVRLTATRVGLLIHQAGGFEHVKRRRDLFVADAGKLRKVWSVLDGAGPVRSAAYVVPAENRQYDEILYFDGLIPGGAEPDSLSAQRLAWDETSQALRANPMDSLPAVIAGEFPNVEAARSAQANACLAEYWVLPADRFGGSPARYVLAMVVPDRQNVDAEMARSCDGLPERRLAQFRSFMGGN